MRLAIALIGVFICLQSATAQDEPFTFREIPLGITMAEFKKIPFPDLNKWPTVKPLCAGDADENKLKYHPLKPDGVLGLAGVTACLYVKPEKYLGYLEWAPDFAGVGNYLSTFFFTPPSMPEASRKRLYLISIVVPERHFAVVLAAFTSKYGAPKTHTEMFKTRGGAEFANVISTWSNKISCIRIAHYGSSLDSTLVTYEQIVLANEVAETIQEGAKKAAKQL